MRWCRVADGVVREVLAAWVPLAPELAAQLFEGPDEAVEGWSYDGSTWAEPPPPPPIRRIALQALWRRLPDAKKAAIFGAVRQNAQIFLGWEMIVVAGHFDLDDQNVRDWIQGLVTVGAITQGEADQVLGN